MCIASTRCLAGPCHSSRRTPRQGDRESIGLTKCWAGPASTCSPHITVKNPWPQQGWHLLSITSYRSRYRGSWHEGQRLLLVRTAVSVASVLTCLTFPSLEWSVAGRLTSHMLFLEDVLLEGLTVSFHSCWISQDKSDSCFFHVFLPCAKGTNLPKFKRASCQEPDCT